MSLTEDLPTKLSYECKNNLKFPNVFDFNKLLAKLWNTSRHNEKEKAYFNKLIVWNNINVAREAGFTWCMNCKDTGLFRDTTKKCLCQY
jgi:hypothetical protein